MHGEYSAALTISNCKINLMLTGNKIFDVCFISINEINEDARTLNMARTLVKNAYSVCIIAFGNQVDSDYLSKENIILFPVEKKNYKKALRRIRDFYRGSKKYFDIATAKYYIAEDLYSLRVAVKLKKLFGGKLIYDSREIYSALGPLSDKPFRQRILTAYEKHYIKKVDKFIVTGSLDEEYLRSHFKTDKPFTIIMNLPPYRDVVKSNLLREEIINQALKYKVNDRVILCGAVPYDELHEWTSSSDVGLSFIEPVSFS